MTSGFQTSFDHIDNVVDVIRAHAQATPDRIAVVEGGREISYSQLQTLIAQYSYYLQTLGLQPGDRLGLVLGDHADHLILCFAAASLGIASVSMNWRGKLEEKQAIADVFGVKLVIGEPNIRTPAGIPSVEFNDAWRQRAGGMAPLAPVDSARALPLRILLTSGTTGVPKGVELTHEGLLAWTELMRLGLGLTSHHRHLSALPLAFTGIQCFTLPHLLLGNTVEMFPPLFTPEEFIEMVKKRNITGSVIVPTILRRLLPMAEDGKRLLPELEYLVSLGAPLVPEERLAAKRRLTPGFVDNYGASGAGCITFLLPADNEAKSESIGKPAPLREVQVVDQAGRVLPAGEVGFLRVRGPGVATGFCNATTEATSEAFRDGWYHPGEIARFDSDGFVVIVGRTSDLIVRGGINIYPAEIERVLLRHPAVREVAVLGTPSAEYGEEVIAFAQVTEGTPERELLEVCRRSLSSHKVPSAIHILRELPKNPAGKILKSELLRMHQQAS